MSKQYPDTIPGSYKLAVVLLNYRTPDLIVQCLESLVPQIDPDQARVVVVDNHSEDGSAAKIQAAVRDNDWSERVTVLESGHNGGFSFGNNYGVRRIDAELYLLLNSDTFLREGALAELVGAADQHPQAAMLSPRLEWPDETPQESTFTFHRPAWELIHSAGTGLVSKAFRRYTVARPVCDRPSDFEWTSFACVMIRKSLFDEIGLLDEGYFMYFEDVDFCRRAHAAGAEVLHWPQARVVHLRGGSSDVKSSIAERKRPPRYFYASRARYYKKFYGRSGLFFTNLLWHLGRTVSWARELVRNKRPHLCQRESRDIWIAFGQPVGEKVVGEARR
ncbi:MAG: family 2 glycosyl transferase [Planctomycetes bacterium]|nr:family 2 glycosyl transferase [Planctomycetota bacterium]